ncbi:MAG TPA: hypothetical protein VHM65_03710 [Candidatus Lustribacter sp.]|nr:hypothetical protein [Candidatus Lustribacter sp.]
MLSLEPPYPVIGGYALLPDHADPLLYYAMPAGPRLAMLDTGPALNLTLYADSGAGAARTSGGILSMTTELVVPGDVLAALPGQLASVRGITGTPRVVPVSFESGTVELAVLGRTSTPPAQGSAAPGGLFELTFVAGGRPSLTGTNDAAFQLVLGESAAEAIEACLDEGAQPVLVTYTMTYAALRPAFTVDLDVDWTKIYHSLQSKLTTNAWFVAADVEANVKSAFEESGIRIDTVVEGTGSGDRAAAERTQAQLLDWVMDRLFEPMIPAVSTAESIGQVVEGALWSLARAVIPGASYRLKVVDETQVRRMNIRARERVAELREVRPQGSIDALLRSLRTTADGTPSPHWPAIRAAMVQRVELDGFPRLEVGVSVVDRFAADGLRSVDVEMARAPAGGGDPPPGDVTALGFTPGTTAQSWVVNLLDEAAREAVWKRPYVYRVVARFDPSSPLRPGEVVTSAWTDRRTSDLLVDPREAYAVTDVSVTVAPLFSFELFPAVTVDLHPGTPGGPATALAGTRRVQLDAEHPLQHWVFTSLPGDLSYSYRATYHRPSEAGGAVTTEWGAAVEPFLSLPDPMPEKLTVTFFVDLPWTELSLAMLQIRYDDAAHDVHYAQETLTLEAGTTHVARTYSIASGGSRSLSYRLTLQRAAGGLVDGSWREAGDDRVVVDRRLVDERAVRVKALGTLADRRLVRAAVRIEARDPAAGLVRAATDVVIPGGGEGNPIAPFTYLLGDPPLHEVWWQLTTVDSNGFPAAQPWGHGTSDLLVVDLRTLSVTG